MTSNTKGDTNEISDFNVDNDADVDDTSFHSVDTGIPFSSSPVCTKKEALVSEKPPHYLKQPLRS